MIPTYMSKNPPAHRSVTTGAHQRMDRQAKVVEEQAEAFLDADTITSLDDLQRVFDHTCLATDIENKFDPKRQHWVFYSISATSTGEPFIRLSVVVNGHLQIRAWANQIEIPDRHFGGLLSQGLLTRADNLLNIIAASKSYASSSSSEKDQVSFEHHVQAIQEQIPDLDAEIQSKVSFLVEQMRLTQVLPKQRRYSLSTLGMSLMWQKTSTACYKQILNDEVLTLPSLSRLQQLSSAFVMETGISQSTRSYVRARFQNLKNPDLERYVEVIQDEVYTSRRCQFSGGTFYGVQNGDISRTILGVMAKSVFGQNKDMISLFPVTKIDAKLLKEYVMAVVNMLQEEGYIVVNIASDGHRMNVALYQELCGNQTSPSFPNPAHPHLPIHCLHDNVHLLKNVLNSFITRRKFDCPDFRGMKLAPDYDHLWKLYELEIGQGVKIAFNLTHKTLAPSRLERTNVMHAARIFSLTTVAGLEHYAKHGYPQFQCTANFIRPVMDWWHVVNCKSRNANIITRDNARGAVISEECFAIQYLREFHQFLIDWNEGTSDKTRKLTAETMKALTFSTKSIISLALLLLNLPGVQYVLLGLINSDPIEKHYGRYRQQAGGDRDLGVLQVLQAEKTIRLKALPKFSGLQMTEICEVFEGTSKQQQEIISKTAKDLLALLSSGINDNLTQHSESQPVIFTCSGYLSWSLRKRISCESCLDLIVNKADGNETSVGFEPEPEQMETELMRTRDELWRSINKGGLVRPSDLMFMSCLLIYSLYDDIRSDHVVGKKLMECQNSRQVFKQMVVMRMTEGTLSSQLLDQKCQLGHSFEQYIPRIAFQFYTMFSKNLANEINSAIHLTRKRVTQDKKCNEAKKVKKLSSK